MSVPGSHNHPRNGGHRWHPHRRRRASHHRIKEHHASASAASLSNFIDTMRRNCSAARDESGHKTGATKPAHESQHWCGSGIQDGLQAAGIHFTRQPESYMLAAELQRPRAGFKSIDVSEINHPQAGDVMFIKPFTVNGKLHHHVATWTGTEWMSDFDQGSGKAGWQVYEDKLKHKVPLDSDHVILLRNPEFAAQAHTLNATAFAMSETGHGHRRGHSLRMANATVTPDSTTPPVLTPVSLTTTGGTPVTISNGTSVGIAQPSLGGIAGPS